MTPHGLATVKRDPSAPAEGIEVSSVQDTFLNYVRIARIDHWFKNVFMLPGILLALALADVPLAGILWPSILALVSVCFIASANYVINEWLDAPYDRHHPVKKYRPSVVGSIKGTLVYLEYGILAIIGLTLARQLTQEFFILAFILLVMGLIYNVPPIRSKDRFLLDVLTESVNNPLRLLLGWSALVSGILPPSSIILSYWMGGAFLMTVKRLAEYRTIEDPRRAALYRRSFESYSELNLLMASFFYALSSAFFLGIFLIKYRVEFLVSFPLFALLFVWYLRIGLRPNSLAQHPERLYKEKNFIAYTVFLVLVVGFLFLVDIPWLLMLTDSIEF